MHYSLRKLSFLLNSQKIRKHRNVGYIKHNTEDLVRNYLLFNLSGF